MRIQFEATIERLCGSLNRLEQQTQEIRWRVVNFPDDLSVLEGEIADLMGEAFGIAVLYGQFSILAGEVVQTNALEPVCDGCGC